MFVKLAVLACSLAAVNAAWNGPLAGGQPASLYPAGVSPQACPNFPNCDNPAVAANPNQASPNQWNQGNQWNGNNQWNQGSQWNGNNQWNQGSQWNQPQPQWNQQNSWNPQAVPQYGNDIQQRLNRGEYVGDGDYHGEGLAEALAPGHGGWQNQGGWNSNQNWATPGAQQAHGVGQIPAGVDARSCPNYPFCS